VEFGKVLLRVHTGSDAKCREKQAHEDAQLSHSKISRNFDSSGSVLALAMPESASVADPGILQKFRLDMACLNPWTVGVS
jgi:hypothetical protein